MRFLSHFFYRNTMYKRFLILRLSLSFFCLKLLLFTQLRNEQLILETQFSKTYYIIMYSLEVLLLCVFYSSYVVICRRKGYGKWRSVNVNKETYTYKLWLSSFANPKTLIKCGYQTHSNIS